MVFDHYFLLLIFYTKASHRLYDYTWHTSSCSGFYTIATYIISCNTTPLAMTIEEAGNSSAEFEFSLPSRYTTPPQTSISGPVILHQSQEAYLTEPTRTEPNQIKLTLPKPNQSLYKIIPFPQGYAGWQYEYICNSGSPRKHYVLVCADCGSQGTRCCFASDWL